MQTNANIQGVTTIIEIRPHRSGGWECFEAPGVKPFSIERDAKTQAIDYATARMKGRRGEIRIYDEADNPESVETFV